MGVRTKSSQVFIILRDTNVFTNHHEYTEPTRFTPNDQKENHISAP